MKKTKKIYEADGQQFLYKKDFHDYATLKESQENMLIQNFRLHYTQLDDEDESRIKLVFEIDNLPFNSRADAFYYLNLKTLQCDGLIRSFSLSQKKSKSESPKYHSSKVTVDETLFDSKTEADYYIHLLRLKQEGIVSDFVVKPRYELQPKFVKNGATIRRIDYTPDFEVFYKDGHSEVIDVKGMITPDFSIKRKLFDYKYQDKHLILMKYVTAYGGWISFDDWKEKKKNQ